MRLFTLPSWIRRYPKNLLGQDIAAGLIVGIIVIPQSLGYAALAELPPVYGLYSAMVPVLVYSWIGASSVNALGPVAVTAIMTAHALQPYRHLSPEQYALLAGLLALLTGLIFWAASLFRLGWITRFISQGVTAGFISGASVLIFISQIKFLIGTDIRGNTVVDYAASLLHGLPALHPPTLLLGAAAFALFFANRYCLHKWLNRRLPAKAPAFLIRLMPLLLMAAATALSFVLDFSARGIATVQNVPKHLPRFVLPFSDGLHQVLNEMIQLLPAAGVLALITFVSSHSVAAGCARRRGENFDTNRELTGLAWANIAGAFFQSFPVGGGFSRTAVNLDAGAQTPLAGMVSVGVMAVFLLFFSEYLAPLPYAVLAANIMVAILAMIDLDTLKRALLSDRTDAAAFLTAFGGVLLFGLNTGLIAGILVSFAGLIWQSSHPHIAIVGRTADGRFRNTARYAATEYASLLIVRIDESMFYGNAQPIRRYLEGALAAKPACRHLVLQLSAVNRIDLTAQEMLLSLNHDLQQRGVTLHFSELKGKTADTLEHSVMLKSLSGKVFATTALAVAELLEEESVWSPVI